MRKLMLLFLICCFGLPLASQEAFAEDEQPKLILSINPDGAVNGSYTENGHTISIEALRGEENIGDDPDMLPYALDIRILDENGIPFLVQNSGVSQGLGDMEWIRVQANPDGAVRQHAIQMLPNAIRYVRAALAGEVPENAVIQNLTDENRWEILAVLDLMRSMAEDIPERAFRKKSSAERLAMAASYTYEYEVSIRKKKVEGLWYTEHSALRVRYYNNTGERFAQYSSCNHGTCADNGVMSTKCSKRFKHNAMIGLVNEVCDTFTSYKYKVHTCHDDTAVQYRTFKEGGWRTGLSVECYAPMLSVPNCE